MAAADERDEATGRIEPKPVAAWYAIGGLVVAYLLVISLMVLGLLPPTVTWAGVGLVPAFFFGSVLLMTLPIRSRREAWSRGVLSLICLAAGYLAVYLQGWF